MRSQFPEDVSKDDDPNERRRPPRLSRRQLIGLGSLAVAFGAAGVANAQPAEAVTLPRKTGPGYVRWEDLAKPGDTLVTAAARLKSPAVITLPNGVFSYPAFTQGANLYGLILAGNFKGLSGSGRGTIVQQTPNSISAASLSYEQRLNSGGINNLNAIVTKGGFNGPEISQLHLRGTEQKGAFHYPILFQRSKNTVFHDVLVTGFPGGAATPPTEVGGVQFGQCTFARVGMIEIDGRRYSLITNRPTVPVSSSLLMINGINYEGAQGNSVLELPYFYLHHGLGNAVAIWHSTNIRFTHPNFVGQINQEESGWIEYDNLLLTTKGPYHYASANDTGTTTFIDPLWAKSTNSSAGAMFATHLFTPSAHAPIVRVNGVPQLEYQQNATGAFSVVTSL
jgi:hypothetical protein